MFFTTRRYVRLLRASLFGQRGLAPGHRRNFRFWAGFLAVFAITELGNRFYFLLDHLLFPRFRRQPVRAPVFVIGNPRSGTTILHRVMAKDTARFFCFRTWEIFFPALVQKKLLAAIGRLDRRWGGHLESLVLRWEARRFAEFNRLHPMGLFLPEEDDKLFVHLLASADLAWFFPYGGFDPLIRFDEAVSPADQRRIMEFYMACVRRQACFQGGDRALLSKNPLFSGKIENLLRTFPDCRIVYLARNPLEVVPSTINLGRVMVRATVGIEPEADLDERLYETIKYYYTYPLERLDRLPENRVAIVNYEELIRAPKRVVAEIYRRLGLELTPEFERRLDEEAAKMACYKSEHRYSLDQCRIDRARIVADLAPIFDRFGFDRQPAAAARA